MDLARAEATVQRAVTEAMAEFLDLARTRLLGTGVTAAADDDGDVPPDLNRWPDDTVWHRLLREKIVPALRAAWGRMFRTVARRHDLAPHQWRQAYLAAVWGRLSTAGWPRRVWNVVRRELDAAQRAGEPIRRMRDRLHAALHINVPGRPWKSDARRIARTEVIAAHNGGAQAGAAARSHAMRVQVTREWLSSHDDRVRPTHREADGQTRPLGEPFLVGGFPLDFPGDPTGPPGEIINCLVDPTTPICVPGGVKPVSEISPGDLVITHTGRARRVLRLAPPRRYSGDVVRIETATGVLRVTPNHPVLTASGWMVARELRAGMIVFRPTFIKPCDDRVDSLLFGVYRHAGSPATSTRRPGKLQQQICLRSLDNQVRPQHRHQLQALACDDLPTQHRRPVLPGGVLVRVHDAHASDLTQETDDSFVAVRHKDTRLILERADRPVSSDPLPANLSDCHDTLAVDHCRYISERNRIHAQIVPTRVRSSRIEHEPGTVNLFNFAVEHDESYIAAGIAVHNCRCTLVFTERPAADAAA